VCMCVRVCGGEEGGSVFFKLVPPRGDHWVVFVVY